MGDFDIRLDRVSKIYSLHRASSLRDEAGRLARRLFLGHDTPRERCTALSDISLEVRRGETVGLIGSNGAGKSTLLKILSRVTVPTSGQFWTSGRVGALIEIGAGFHPDLTGRENVFLNGAILGMRHAEIEAKFDHIVGFAEVEKFLDTPIKYYSSGMLVRLGFAVACHIDPEILLVDEVLAVGDASFQAKCLNKLAELKAQQKTIILVSHVMTNILQDSTRVLWIDRGTVRALGEPERIVEEYLESAQHGIAEVSALPQAPDPSPIRIRDVTIKDSWLRVSSVLEHGRPATIEVGYRALSSVSDPVVAIEFHDARGYPLGGLTTRLDGVKLDATREHGVVRLVLSPLLFTRGAYGVNVAIHDARIQRYLDFRPGATMFTVEGPGIASREVSGHVVYPHRWEVETSDAARDTE